MISHSICQPRLFWRLLWRVVLVLIMAGLALQNLKAEMLISAAFGDQKMPVQVLGDMVRAEQQYPFDYNIRMAPAGYLAALRQIMSDNAVQVVPVR